MRAKRDFNPYWSEFLNAKAFIEEHKDEFDFDSWYYAKTFMHRYSWAVPTPTALRAIRDFSPNGVVEIGAGTGYWARLLRAMDVDVVAYDARPVQLGRNRFHNRRRAEAEVRPWTEVLRGGPESAALHPDRALMLCYPPSSWKVEDPLWQRRMSHRALSAYAGNKLIYIGSKDNMITGSKKFHQMVAHEWSLVRRIRLRGFFGLDYLNLYERRSPSKPRSAITT